MVNYSTAQFRGKTLSEIRKELDSYYKEKLQGKVIVNKDTGLTIRINKVSRDKTAWGGVMNSVTAVAILHIETLLKNAKRGNWGNPKPKHIQKYNALGFVNFNVACTIDNVKRSFRIPVMVTKGGKFQYYINENIKGATPYN